MILNVHIKVILSQINYVARAYSLPLLLYTGQHPGGKSNVFIVAIYRLTKDYILTLVEEPCELDI